LNAISYLSIRGQLEGKSIFLTSKRKNSLNVKPKFLFIGT